MNSAALQFFALFRKQPETARELIAVGDSIPDAELNPIELATWTMVANTVLNRDDFINK